MSDIALEQWTQDEQWTVLNIAEQQQSWFVSILFIIKSFLNYRERGAELMNSQFASSRGKQYFTAAVCCLIESFLPTALLFSGTRN